MSHIRRDVWKLPAGDTTLEWYGKAVQALQQRPVADVTSWWSLAAMHGIDQDLWHNLSVDPSFEPADVTALQQRLWDQCQHQTWFFLPWHRGYLAAFERIVRDAVTRLGGPGDWALPYWNYSDDPAARELPRAFANPTLPDGGKNFLHVKQRYGTAVIPNVQSPILLDERTVMVAKTLQQPFFAGLGSGGTSGFGGVRTPFHHGDNAGTFGGLEIQPHGIIHTAVGGPITGGGPEPDLLDLGLMTNPDTAALDPIFWLHHANIDRLWTVWSRQAKRPTDPADAFQNPTDADWLDGPRDRRFLLPRPDGTTYGFTAREMLDTTAPSLDYVYEHEATPAPPLETLVTRFQRLGATAERAHQLAGAVAMAPPKPPELLGASPDLVRLDRDSVEARVMLDPAPRHRLTAALRVDRADAGAPDRVYLNLENIRSPSDAAMFYVYVDLPSGADPERHPANFAGTISLFGVSKASVTRGGAPGNGATISLDITEIVDAMQAKGGLGDDIAVRVVAAVPGATNDDISIGRISVYRQGH